MASLFHENSLSHPDGMVASAPLRSDRTGHVDRRSIVVVSGGRPAGAQVKVGGGCRGRAGALPPDRRITMADEVARRRAHPLR
jgi:hypothetical protein